MTQCLCLWPCLGPDYWLHSVLADSNLSSLCPDAGSASILHIAWPQHILQHCPGLCSDIINRLLVTESKFTAGLSSLWRTCPHHPEGSCPFADPPCSAPELNPTDALPALSVSLRVCSRPLEFIHDFTMYLLPASSWAEDPAHGNELLILFLSRSSGSNLVWSHDHLSHSYLKGLSSPHLEAFLIVLLCPSETYPSPSAHPPTSAILFQ